MPRLELSRESEYFIPGNLYRQCIYFCRQYPDWAAALSSPPDSGKGIDYSVPRVQTSGDFDPVEAEGIRRHQYAIKKQIVDDAIMEAAPEIAKWLLLGVAYRKSFEDLEAMGMPCGREYYFRRRRKFFWLLSFKI